jgi:hypothetical protein
MGEHDEDFGQFIRAQTARMDRSYRDLAKVIQRNGEIVDRALKKFDAMDLDRVDERAERKAHISALMRLIDRLDSIERRIDPGEAPGSAPA